MVIVNLDRERYQSDTFDKEIVGGQLAYIGQ